MKKTVSILLVICVTAGILASCAQTDTSLQTTEDPQSSVAKETEQTTFETTTAEETTVEETTEEATTAAPLVMTPAVPFNPADRLEPTSADLERLAALLDWGSFVSQDYSSDTDPILDYIWFAIHMGMEQYDLLQDRNTNSDYDPRGLFGASCQGIRADVMEYYLENVFHNTSYRTARDSIRQTGENNEYKYGYYYQDGWYYFSCEHTGKEEGLQIREHQLQSNGHYSIIIDEVSWFDENDPPEPISTIRVDATLTQKDGRRLWTVYSTKMI